MIYYHAALQAIEQFKNPKQLSMIYNNIGDVFVDLKQYEKAVEYLDKSVNLATQAKDTAVLCFVLGNKGATLNFLKEFDKSIELEKEVLRLAEKKGYDNPMWTAYRSLGYSYRNKGIYDTAIYYGLKSLEHATKLSDQYNVARAKYGLGDLYFDIGNFKEAKSFYLQTIELADSINATELKALSYKSLHTLYAKQNDFKQAYKYQALAQQYQDSILSEKQMKTINELEVKYQSLQKDKELAQNQLQLQKSKDYIIYSIGAALIALLVAALIFLYYRNKRRTYLRQLKLVKQEKEVQVLQALMQGEEKERTRIAHDLHDEVAGMLAAAKMNLNALAMQVQDVVEDKGYHKVMDLLDETSVRVRNTAHNLLPEILMQHGLEKAINKYCNNISNDSFLTVRFYSLGGVERYALNFELAVYRIVQELLNNIIKHAKATEVLVQLGVQHNVLFITVEDNGIGFNASNVSSEGTGLKSLQARVKALNGKIDITSEVGEGVSAHLEFDITIMKEQVAIRELFD